MILHNPDTINCCKRCYERMPNELVGTHVIINTGNKCSKCGGKRTIRVENIQGRGWVQTHPK